MLGTLKKGQSLLPMGHWVVSRSRDKITGEGVEDPVHEWS